MPAHQVDKGLALNTPVQPFIGRPGARTGSFSRAARELGYAQPTVSTHIQSLEKELNTRLFERLGHRIVMTREGESLFNYADGIIKLSQEAVETLAAFSEQGTIAGKMAIGANESFSVVRLPAILKRFLQQHPRISISLKFGSVAGIHQQLQDNTIDIAFFLTREVAYSDLVVEKLLPEPVVMVAAPDHPAAASVGTAGLNLLEHQDLIVTQENCTYRAMLNELLKEARVRPRSVIEINNIQAIKQLAMSGLGITLLPRVSVEHELAQNMLVELPWEAADLPVFTQIAHHKNKWLSPAIVSFIEETRSSLVK